MREYVGSGLAFGCLSHNLARNELRTITKSQLPLKASDNEVVTPHVL